MLIFIVIMIALVLGGAIGYTACLMFGFERVDEEELILPVLSTEATVARIEGAVEELRALLAPAVAQLPKTRSKKALFETP